jgi:hypothetical protein
MLVLQMLKVIYYVCDGSSAKVYFFSFQATHCHDDRNLTTRFFVVVNISNPLPVVDCLVVCLFVCLFVRLSFPLYTVVHNHPLAMSISSNASHQAIRIVKTIT